MITINGTTKTPADWEVALSKSVDTGWFDCIARHLEAAKIQIGYKLAKRKACHVRMARLSSCYSLHAKYYKEDFGEAMPLRVDGKDYRDFISHAATTA